MAVKVKLPEALVETAKRYGAKQRLVTTGAQVFSGALIYVVFASAKPAALTAFRYRRRRSFSPTPPIDGPPACESSQHLTEWAQPRR